MITPRWYPIHLAVSQWAEISYVPQEEAITMKGKKRTILIAE